MKKRILLSMVWVLATSVSMAYADSFVNNMVGEPYLQPMGPSSHRSVTGTVIKIRSDMVFLRTDQGTIRAVGLKALQRDGMPSIKAGDQVDLIVDRGNSVLAIAPPRGTGAYIGNEVTGTVQRFDILNKQIAIKTKEGDTQSIQLRQGVATKLNGVGKGSAVSLEMDGHDRAFDAYKVD
jgi:hypothetical protein